MTDPAVTPLAFSIPQLYCPFPTAIHPEVDTLTRAGMDFMTHHGFCNTEADRLVVANIDAGAIVARWYPNPDFPVDRLQMVTDFLYLYFLIDDLRFEVINSDTGLAGPIALFAQHLDLWEYPQAHRREELDLFHQAIHDLASRMAELTTPTKAARMRRSINGWFLALLREIALFNDDHAVMAEEYLPIRVVTVASRLMIDVNGFICPAEVPGDEWYSLKVQAAAEAAMSVCLYDNELYSAGKEQWLKSRATAHDRRPRNLVALIQAQTGGSTEHALQEVAEYRNRTVCLYLNLRSQLEKTASPALLAYLSVLDGVISGNLDAHATSSRYHNPDGHHPHAIAFTPLRTTDECSARAHTPIAPPIAWWWEQLDQ
uniref:Diterpene cyclase DtcycA n=1 Tax=Streptomyces sp. TaxID=1931 RepID=DTCYA_STRSQ|nr:RecName: Full=Diterpene cyclase DtcycA; AltName: Full=Cembrene C synthase; AltName: Full=Nephthenol synthase [Streptomyces sp.]BAM78697.1 diterpene cyclase [Streptomyces sp. SANK 60404]